MNMFDQLRITAINIDSLSNLGKITSTRYHFSPAHAVTKSSSPVLRSVNFLVSDRANFKYHKICNQDFGISVRIKKVDPQTIFKRIPKTNVPNLIQCEKCKINYPTRYQFQRHRCELNAEKVAPLDQEKNSKYDCPTCGKLFVSKNNLERHKTSHNSEDTTCEFCKKKFVSANRLRIHVENHCKKAGEIDKFYRTDVTVWKCRKCNEVFPFDCTAAHHSNACTELTDSSINETEPLTETENVETKTIESTSTEILLQCEFCNRTYADKKILLKHQKTHKTDKNYECVTCKEVFESYILASQHWLQACSDKVNFFYLPKVTYCEFCDRTFRSHEILYKHKIKKSHFTPKIHESDTIKSNQDKDTKNEGTIDKLVDDVLIALEKSMNKSSTDDKENQSSTSKEMTEITTEPLSQSSVPEKKKRGRKRKHPEQQPQNFAKKGFKYQCECCTEVWNSITELEAHRKIKHPANFKCEECGKVLQSASALSAHNRMHKNLKPYVCYVCNRSYSQTSHLWQHMRFHQGIKPFACPHKGCEARYTVCPDLKDHIRRVHTRERPFKCNACDKCFLTGSVYYQHRLIHNGDRRHRCDMCEKVFFRADALINHRRIHTNEKPFPCFVCGKLFRQKGDRNKHCKTQHPVGMTF